MATRLHIYICTYEFYKMLKLPKMHALRFKKKTTIFASNFPKTQKYECVLRCLTCAFKW